MTSLQIIPIFQTKTAKIVGTIAAGEHVAVTIVGGNAVNTSTLYLRIVCAGKTIAQFPAPVDEGEEQESWETSGDDIAATLNLNTVEALGYCKAPQTGCVAVLEDVGDTTASPVVPPQLYFVGECIVNGWPQKRTEEKPYSLDAYPGLISRWTTMIDSIAASVTKSGTTATISITDKNGTTTTAMISDGAKGDKGDVGEKGDKGDKGDKGEKGDAGTADYDDLENKPAIDGKELNSTSTAVGLGLQKALTFDDTPTVNSDNPVKSSGILSWVKSLLPSWLTSDYAEPATTASVEERYAKPEDGIPVDDLAKDVQSALTNARTPTAHAASHAANGTDPITPAMIGAVASNLGTSLDQTLRVSGYMMALDGETYMLTSEVDVETSSGTITGWQTSDGKYLIAINTTTGIVTFKLDGVSKSSVVVGTLSDPPFTLIVSDVGTSTINYVQTTAEEIVDCMTDVSTVLPKDNGVVSQIALTEQTSNKQGTITAEYDGEKDQIVFSFYDSKWKSTSVLVPDDHAIVTEGLLYGETMSGTPSQNELADALKTLWTKLGGTITALVAAFCISASGASTNEAAIADITASTGWGDIPPIASIGRVMGQAGVAPNSFASVSNTVSAWETYWDGDDVRVTVTNYDSSVHLPSLYLEQNTNEVAGGSAVYRTVWSEMTRWDAFLSGYAAFTNNAAQNYADRAWGVYEASTGEYSPDGMLQIATPQIQIASGLAYQKTITTGGCALWVLKATEPVTLGGTTNGFFRIEDGDGNALFEIVKGDKRTVGATATAITTDGNGMTVTYSVNSQPTLSICTNLLDAVWLDETECSALASVSWAQSGDNWVATVTPTEEQSRMFAKATYTAGGETYIKNSAPVGFSQVYIDGTNYTVHVETVNGKKVMVLQ